MQLLYWGFRPAIRLEVATEEGKILSDYFKTIKNLEEDKKNEVGGLANQATDLTRISIFQLKESKLKIYMKNFKVHSRVITFIRCHHLHGQF